jgi:hypothetical protein
MPETEFRLGKGCSLILDLFRRKRRWKARVQKSRAKAGIGFLRGRESRRPVCARTTPLHLADHEKPQGPNEDQGSQIEEPCRPTLLGRFSEPDIHSMLQKGIEHRSLVLRTDDSKAAAFCVKTANCVTRYRDAVDLAVCDHRHKFGITYLRTYGAIAARLHNLPKQKRAHHDDHPEN